MKTIIKITKQEAVDAWKAQNNYQNDTEITIEIEDTGYYMIPPTYSNKCLICGQELSNGFNGGHICRTGTYPYAPTFC